MAYEATLNLYEKLLATVPEIDRKGKTMPYTSHNGNMFSFLTKAGSVALRLGEDDRNAFLKRYKTKLIMQHGIIMKEYVSVPAALLKKTNELKKYLKLSYRYVSSLKKKPTKRAKAKKR